MQTLCALLLFAGAASTIAFTPHESGRYRRGAGGASAGAGAGATASSFATSGAYGSGHGGGGAGGAGGAGGFAFPGPASYGPASFEAAFRSYFDQMEAMLAAQQAHAQALSNRFWAEWQNSIPHHAEAAQQSTNSVSGGYSPQYFQYGIPQASHSHTAVNFYPHRFNPANANSIGNNVDAGQVSYGGSYGIPASSTNYASVSSDNGGGVGYGGSYGGSYGGGFGGSLAGAGGAGLPGAGYVHTASPGQSGYSAGGNGGNGHAGSGLGGNAQGAQASLAVNDRGGFGEAQLFPDPDLSSRISGDIAPLSGGSYGVFSSSSSSSHSDPSGKTHTFKQATVGVNDNGKVTTFSVKDP